MLFFWFGISQASNTSRCSVGTTFPWNDGIPWISCYALKYPIRSGSSTSMLSKPQISRLISYILATIVKNGIMTATRREMVVRKHVSCDVLVRVWRINSTKSLSQWESGHSVSMWRIAKCCVERFDIAGYLEGRLLQIFPTYHFNIKASSFVVLCYRKRSLLCDILYTVPWQRLHSQLQHLCLSFRLEFRGCIFESRQDHGSL